MAKAADVSLTSVQPIWRAHGLAPHRIRTFKLSNDPKFAAKVRDIVGLYVDLPAHAVVLSVDEKSQIQALDRTQPGLPLKKGRAGTMTHDYKRNGTTTLFAAFDVLEGKVIGRCMQRHRHQEFIRFLNAIEREVPAGKTVHAILDNYATHKHPKVIEWLEHHPRWRRGDGTWASGGVSARAPGVRFYPLAQSGEGKMFKGGGTMHLIGIDTAPDH
jgi:transposase